MLSKIKCFSLSGRDACVTLNPPGVLYDWLSVVMHHGNTYLIMRGHAVSIIIITNAVVHLVDFIIRELLVVRP